MRNLEIIGEAASRLPEEFTSRHPATEWTKIVGLRHRIVHGYFGLDLEIIWTIVECDLPELKSALLRLADSARNASDREHGNP